MIFILLMIVGLFSICYYIFAASYAGVASSFLSFWLVLSVASFVSGAGYMLMKKMGLMDKIPFIIKGIFVAIVLVGILFFIVLEGMIISKMNEVPTEKVDYIVVLGAQVRGTRVTKSLARRLNVAYDYANKNKNVTVIVSGGQGKGEDISEADAMEGYLIEKGLDADRIIKENKSTTTKENLIFSKEIINDGTADIAVVTNNFHVYRAMKLAEKIGFKSVQGLAGKADKRLLLNYMVREAFALAKEYMVGNI